MTSTSLMLPISLDIILSILSSYEPDPRLSRRTAGPGIFSSPTRMQYSQLEFRRHEALEPFLNPFIYLSQASSL